MAATWIALEDAQGVDRRPETGRGTRTSEWRLVGLSIMGALGLHAGLFGLFLLDWRPGTVRAFEAIPVTLLVAEPGEPLPVASGKIRDPDPPPPVPDVAGGTPSDETPRHEKTPNRNKIVAEADRPSAPSRSGTALPFHQDATLLRASDVPLPRPEADDPMSYKRIILGRLAKAKQFPPEARSRGARGVAVVAFRLGERGDLAGVALLRSSGETALDRESLALIARAAPFPVPPAGAQRTFAVDIAFGMGR
jgi:TonB family protein